MQVRIFFGLLFLIVFTTVSCTKTLPPLEFPMTSEDIFFDCNDNKFISQELICDGHEDCLNGADEQNCEQQQK